MDYLKYQQTKEVTMSERRDTRCPADNPTSDVLSPRGVAALLGVSIAHVHRITKDGLINGKKIGRLVRYSRRDVLRLIDEPVSSAS